MKEIDFIPRVYRFPKHQRPRYGKWASCVVLFVCGLLFMLMNFQTRPEPVRAAGTTHIQKERWADPSYGKAVASLEASDISTKNGSLSQNDLQGKVKRLADQSGLDLRGVEVKRKTDRHIEAMLMIDVEGKEEMGRMMEFLAGLEELGIVSGVSKVNMNSINKNGRFIQARIKATLDNSAY